MGGVAGGERGREVREEGRCKRTGGERVDLPHSFLYSRIYPSAFACMYTSISISILV